MGIIGKNAGNELNDSGGRLFRQAPEPLESGAGDFDLPRSITGRR